MFLFLFGSLANNGARAACQLDHIRYVDHAVVEMIANATLSDNQTGAYISDSTTALAAWVNPTLPTSASVALFSEMEGVTLESLDVWQLSSPSHTV